MAKNSICIYNWLPIAPNMMSEIESNLSNNEYNDLSGNTKEVGDLQKETGENNYYKISYTVKEKFLLILDDSNMSKSFLKFSIDSEGFCEFEYSFDDPITASLIQNYLDSMINIASYSLISGCNLSYTQNNFIEINAILPHAVKNKLAILQEKILEKNSFYSTEFEENYDPPAREFLNRYCTIGFFANVNFNPSCEITLEKPKYYSEGKIFPEIDEHIISISNINFQVKDNDRLVFFQMINIENENSERKNDIIFFHIGNNKNNDKEKAISLLKYYAFYNALVLTLQILKEVRDYIVKIRREFITDIKYLFIEDFPNDLIERKKYLAYINIKLPVIVKIVKHFGILSLPDNKTKFNFINFDEDQKFNLKLNPLPEKDKNSKYYTHEIILKYIKLSNVSNVINEADILFKALFGDKPQPEFEGQFKIARIKYEQKS